MLNEFAGFDLSGVDDVETEDYGRWLIHGPQGSGKSTLASTIARLGPTLYIDLIGEKGVRSFRGAPYAKNIRVVRPESITALDDIFWKLNAGGHPFKAVVIDSLTSAQKMAMRYLMGYDETAVREIKQGTAPADIRTWGQALDIMSDLAQFWNGLADGTREQPMHVVMTAQTKVTENELTGEKDRMPDVQKGALSAVKSNPDYILYTDLETNMEAVGDETAPPMHHIVRFGSNTEYSTKARIPINLRGKVPPILGRERPADLAQLSRLLGIGGVPASKPPAKKTPTKENKETA